MKYTKEERLDIGRRIYDGEFNRYQAAKEYDISEQTARNYMRLYRDLNGLPAKRGSKRGLSVSRPLAEPAGMEEFESMTKEELIMELMKARIAESCTKKGGPFHNGPPSRGFGEK